MRRINLALLAFFQLSRARSPGFSIHADLLAFPQFEVVFSENYIYEKDAQDLLDGHTAHPTYSAHDSQPTQEDSDSSNAAGNGATRGTSEPSDKTYEVMKISSNNYLCSIPVVEAPPPENKTANELAKAEEARELSRATSNGWELLNELDGACLYFILGWWSYSFCNNREIVQFHSLPAPPDGQPPRRDPHTAEYVLGRHPTLPPSRAQQAQEEPDAAELLPAEIQVNGNQRYLVQRLDGGTICDLTGRERTIEVQYHCAPGLKQDRIGWIKEVTICSYIMAINTPRLCNDVAFLPPKETTANPINCQLIVGDDETLPPLLEHNAEKDADTTAPAQEQQEALTSSENQLAGKEPPPKRPVVVGGIEIGARNIISGADEPGQPPMKLSPPRSYFSNVAKRPPPKQQGDVVAQAKSKEDGGDVQVLSEEELEKLDISPDVIEEMREQMERLAGDLGWTLEVVKLPGDGDMRELRGVVDGDEEEEEEEATGGAKAKSGEEGSEEKFFAKEEL